MKKSRLWAIPISLFATVFMYPSQTFAQKIQTDSIDTHSNQQNNRAMIAVIFEVYPAEGHKQEYLNIARGLLPRLNNIDGFISIERFESLYTPGKILSLSFWRDEEAVKQWRNTEEHRRAQEQGRQEVFRDYRLRVVSVIRDYGMSDRVQAPDDSKAHHNKSKN